MEEIVVDRGRGQIRLLRILRHGFVVGEYRRPGDAERELATLGVLANMVPDHDR